MALGDKNSDLKDSKSFGMKFSGVKKSPEHKQHITFNPKVDQKNIRMILPEEPACVLAHKELGR